MEQLQTIFCTALNLGARGFFGTIPGSSLDDNWAPVNPKVLTANKKKLWNPGYIVPFNFYQCLSNNKILLIP